MGFFFFSLQEVLVATDKLKKIIANTFLVRIV